METLKHILLMAPLTIFLIIMIIEMLDLVFFIIMGLMWVGLISLCVKGFILGMKYFVG